MIDREKRIKLAFHLRQLSVGLVSNDTFENAIKEDVSDGWLPEQYYQSKKSKSKDEDHIIKPMLEFCWGLYDDTRNHKLKKGDALTNEAMKIVARCILFLHSDYKYEWPYFDVKSPLFSFSLKDLILSILSLGHHYRNKRKEQLISFDEWQKLGDYNFWPFFRKIDYEVQLTKHPFLAGKKWENA